MSHNLNEPQLSEKTPDEVSRNLQSSSHVESDSNNFQTISPAPKPGKKKTVVVVVLVLILAVLTVVGAMYVYNTRFKISSPTIPDSTTDVTNYEKFESENYSLMHPDDWLVLRTDDYGASSGSVRLTSPDFKIDSSSDEMLQHQGYAFIVFGAQEVMDGSDTNPMTYETNLRSMRESAANYQKIEEVQVDGNKALLTLAEVNEWELEVYKSNQVYVFSLSAPMKDKVEAENLFYAITASIRIK